MQRENKPSEFIKTEESPEQPPPLLPEFTSIPRQYMIRPSSSQFASSSNHMAPPTKMSRYGPTAMMMPRRSANSAPNPQSIENYNEQAAMQFLLGNGLPMEKIHDEHLTHFLNLLNHRRVLPDKEILKAKAHSVSRPTLPYHQKNGPISVTIEAVRKSDEVFLTISVHFIDNLKQRRNSVHFEKIILADYEGKVVADRIRRVVDPRRTGIEVVNIVSPNIRMVQLVSQSTKLKNTFICFFSYISNIAREVCHIDEFSMPLQSLREYVDAIRNHREVYTKFKRLQIEAHCQLPLPNLDVPTEWLSTLQFLSSCGQLSELFERIGETWCMPEYMSVTDQSALANLLQFLTVLCKVSTQVCREESCISQVLPSMSIISNAIEEVGTRSGREKMRKIFKKYYESISKEKERKTGDFYSISSLLDPRYGFSPSIFTDDDWEKVEKKLTFNEVKKKKLEREMEEFKLLLVAERPHFQPDDSVFDWWKARELEFPLLLGKWIQYSGVPAVSVDGKRFFAKGGKLAHLFATIDESMDQRALLLAQSSQDFVGRGTQSHQYHSQVKNAKSTFKKVEFEFDLGEGEEEFEELIFPDNIKQENIINEEPEDKKPEFRLPLLEPKLEQPEEPVEQIEIKMEPLD